MICMMARVKRTLFQGQTWSVKPGRVDHTVRPPLRLYSVWVISPLRIELVNFLPPVTRIKGWHLAINTRTLSKFWLVRMILKDLVRICVSGQKITYNDPNQILPESAWLRISLFSPAEADTSNVNTVWNQRWSVSHLTRQLPVTSKGIFATRQQDTSSMIIPPTRQRLFMIRPRGPAAYCGLFFII